MLGMLKFYVLLSQTLVHYNLQCQNQIVIINENHVLGALTNESLL